MTGDMVGGKSGYVEFTVIGLVSLDSGDLCTH